MLNATEPYDSWAYKSLENSRAAEGKDEDADKVHRNKNWRELDEKFGYEKESLSFTAHPVLRSIASLCMVSAVGPLIIPWGSCAQAATLFLIGLMLFFGHFVKLLFWDWLVLGVMMGFGTRFWPALVLWLAFALGLAFVLSDAHNIQPTFAAVNVELGKVDKSRTELKRNFPQTREWGLGNAFWLALDITVPLIPFNLHDEWEPKESTEGTVNPLSPSEQLWIAPKTLANILVPVSWAIWSLIATGMAGLIRTRN